MLVSMNIIKKYIDLPADLTMKKLAEDLTLRTVEVESVENTKDKYHDIVVGKILEVKNHTNADSLKVCIVDIGLDNPVQIVCGGTNLYVGEMVVVSKPGAEVYWHGESSLTKIKESSLRGESSFGMICGAEEVYLENIFPPKTPSEIVDLANTSLICGQNIADALNLNDTILEIDNKSLSNRPDLWGHYGIARELSVIYNLELKKLSKLELNKDLPKYQIEIQNKNKCKRYMGISIDNTYVKDSPLWLKVTLNSVGIRPINALVDITNYVMILLGQPTHAFDKTHIEGDKIIVRDAIKGENLLLLDDENIELTETDLVIADLKGPLALAGIRGGKNDSILKETTKVLLEIANFDKETIRKTGKRFTEKTDASMRYEKGLDVYLIDYAAKEALDLFKELYPDAKVTAFNDVNYYKEEPIIIDVEKKFLDERLGKVLTREVLENLLSRLGYTFKFENETYKITVPSFRATGDVSLKDDILGDIARLLGYDSFSAKPLLFNAKSAINQREILLDRRVREYLAKTCGFYETITYPWIEEKYIDASGIDKSTLVKLATPPAPNLAYLRGSLIPATLENIGKNLRYYDEFRLFTLEETYKKGEYHESDDEEVLPIPTKLLTATIVGKNAKKVFYDLKGILDNISRECHMESISLKVGEKPYWADRNAYLDIVLNDEVIGKMGLISVKTMMDVKIKHSDAAIFELNFDKLIPLKSRDNNYENLPLLPLIEKDLSLIMDKKVSWSDIKNAISSKVKTLEFVDEYTGNQIPEGKKSITIKVKFENNDVSMTTEEINTKIKSILKTLDKAVGAKLREE